MMTDEWGLKTPIGADMEHELEALRQVCAPSTLLPGVLTRIGLIDAYFGLDSPIGPVFIAYNRQGISAVLPQTNGQAFEAAFAARIGRPILRATEPPVSLRDAIAAHLAGKRRSLRFDLRGLSEFEEAVLRKALEIPRGEVRPYAWVAREIGCPRAVRAVGTALARNPIPLLIPCHRVVRSDGALGQYGLGTPNKRVMLEAEGAPPDLEEMTRGGTRFVGSDSTRIYCFPTCRHARRIQVTHRHAFRSHQEAEVAGYRPCRVCRPAEQSASA